MHRNIVWQRRYEPFDNVAHLLPIILGLAIKSKMGHFTFNCAKPSIIGRQCTLQLENKNAGKYFAAAAAAEVILSLTGIWPEIRSAHARPAAIDALSLPKFIHELPGQ